jgi:Transglycosylase SLT domain
MANFQSPANDYSTFQQASSNNQQAPSGGARMDFSGFSPSPEPRSGGVGPQMEAPTPDFMQTIAEIESSNNPNQQTGRYKGLYQLSDEEFRKYGGQGSIFDPEQNTKAATAKMTAEGQRAQDRLGRALSPVEQYMVHQQGLAGTLSHLSNPDQPAWKSFQQAAGNNETQSKAAIWKNLTPEMKAQFGNDVNNVTSRDFIKLWTDRYNALQRSGKQ